MIRPAHGAGGTPADPRAYAGEAIFDGCIAIAPAPRADVARLLPSDLELADAGPTEQPTHPIAFVFGEQRSARPLFGGLRLPVGADYGECAVMVPFVRYRGAADVLSYAARMYSTYFPPVWDGNVRYGFSKSLARMWRQGGMFALTDERDALLIHAGTEPAGEWSAGNACALPGFSSMEEMFALPVAGRKTDGTWVQSFFGWDFRAAAVRPARAWITIDAPVLPTIVAGACYDAASAFEVRAMRWRLSWPTARRHEEIR